ncbi:MAG: acyltransferase [Actinobacteria bacterium]|nr:acyltransferase [Actinomycetota bacterium]
MNTLNARAPIHSDRRLPALTGLRIFAAVFVYFNHLSAPAGAPGFIGSFLESGYCGVTIFFVLSGFVLAFNYFDDLARPKACSVYEFLVARFARVYPVYLLVLAFIVLNLQANGASIDGWWRNALAIQAWDPNVTNAFSFDAPAWSVSVEFFLYACFPLLVPVIARLRTPPQILVAAVFVAALVAGLAAWFVATGRGDLSVFEADSAHRWLYRTPLTRLGDFTLGILAARLFVTAGRRPLAVRVCRWLTPLAALAIVALMAWRQLFITAWSWDIAYAIPATCLIFGLAVAPRTPLPRLLALPAIVLLGEASYAFYLIHEPMIAYLGGGKWIEDGSLSRIIFEGMVLGATLAFAVGLHITVEMPARKRLRTWLSLRSGSPITRLRERRVTAT